MMYLFFKRIFDVVVATVALIVLSPLLLPSIIILAVTGEREVFYLQQRVGFKNKLFNIYKFATMLKNSPNIGTGEITLRNDPRVTAFGKFLRITKINELPQIINVLRGHMSIVGPRPLMPVSVALYPPHIKDNIYNAKPGITGIGSLIFRDEEKIISDAADPKAKYAEIYPYKGALEMWYQKNASMYTDVMIVFLTAYSIVAPKNQLAFKIFNNLPKRNF
jgi:lipopolysaccharide/colanic/teichoic acid biosynthesis glycosyltransferase